MEEKHVTEKDFKRLEKKVDDIMDNHLNSIWTAIQFVMKDISNLRWWVLASVTILGVVLAILEVMG